MHPLHKLIVTALLISSSLVGTLLCLEAPQRLANTWLIKATEIDLPAVRRMASELHFELVDSVDLTENTGSVLVPFLEHFLIHSGRFKKPSGIFWNFLKPV
jgi:hypothetical protein